jgi:pyrroline-5-carboxylate reductase
MLDSITFIGGGVMAEAMIGGLLNRHIITPDKITVGEPTEKTARRPCRALWHSRHRQQS